MMVASRDRVSSRNHVFTFQGTVRTTLFAWTVVDLAHVLKQQQIAVGAIQARNLLTLVTIKGVRTHHLTMTLTGQDLTQIAASIAQLMIKQALSSVQLQAPQGLSDSFL